MILKGVSGEKPCICIKYPDCKFMGDYKNEEGEPEYFPYAGERWEKKVCNDKSEVLFCIANPIPQDPKRLKQLKDWCEEAKKEEDHYVTISPLGKGNPSAFTFKYIINNRVAIQVLLNRKDAIEISR